jgi:ABC-type multidrug transport system ATPase subunit
MDYAYGGAGNGGRMLRLSDISISRGGKLIIDKASLTAERGDVVALLGPNGAGKTTLLQFLAGVLEADSGDVLYEGRQFDRSSKDWRRRLSYVLDTGGIIPVLTVEEQLSLQCALTGVGTAESTERVYRTVDMLDMRKYQGHRGDELSAGLCKRLAIGIGIIRDAEVFLFDEPFGSLDIQAATTLTRILMTLKKRERIVVVASHSFPILDDLYNRVWGVSNTTIQDHHDGADVNSYLENIDLPDDPQHEVFDIPWIR